MCGSCSSSSVNHDRFASHLQNTEHNSTTQLTRSGEPNLWRVSCCRNWLQIPHLDHMRMKQLISRSISCCIINLLHSRHCACQGIRESRGASVDVAVQYS